MLWECYVSQCHVLLCCPSQDDCKNYVRLLEFLEDGRIYACGTFAFDPQCGFIVSVHVSTTTLIQVSSIYFIGQLDSYIETSTRAKYGG